MIVLTHGVGTRTDLPIPLALTLYGAAMAVAISFAALLLLWRTPRLNTPNRGRPLPMGLQRVADAPALRRVAQGVMLTLATVVTAVALAGPPNTTDNLAPYAVYITLWVGLVPASLLLGPVWRVVNPLRLLHRGMVALAGPAPAGDRLDRWGYWPAAVALAAFVWLELVYPERSDPRVVGMFLVLYSAVQLIAAMWLGERWFARGDAFEVYSTLLGRLAPIGRRADGRLALRNPLRNAATLEDERGLAAVVIVLVGSTSFDGLSRTEFWTQGPGADNGTVSGTLGLLAMIAIVAVLYLGGTVLGGILSKDNPREQPVRYAHSMLPIAVAYAVAHYFSLLLIDGQATWILASNPFGQEGVDLFGTYGNAIDYTRLSPDTISYIQVGAVVVGHVAAVFLAHDRALRANARSRFDQLPLVLVMIGFTVGALALLFGA